MQDSWVLIKEQFRQYQFDNSPTEIDKMTSGNKPAGRSLQQWPCTH